MQTHPTAIPTIEPTPAERKALFGKRLAAAQIDVVITGALCLVLFWAAGAFSSARHPLWKPTTVVLATLCLIELLTGKTPGKLATGVTLRTLAGRQPSILSLAIRGLVRQVPLMIFATTLYVHEQPANATIFFVAFLVACCYVSVSYIMLMRRGQTLFDTVAGTVLVSARAAERLGETKA